MNAADGNNGPKLLTSHTREMHQHSCLIQQGMPSAPAMTDAGCHRYVQSGRRQDPPRPRIPQHRCHQLRETDEHGQLLDEARDGREVTI